VHHQDKEKIVQKEFEKLNAANFELTKANKELQAGIQELKDANLKL